MSVLKVVIGLASEAELVAMVSLTLVTLPSAVIILLKSYFNFI